MIVYTQCYTTLCTFKHASLAYQLTYDRTILCAWAGACTCIHCTCSYSWYHRIIYTCMCGTLQHRQWMEGLVVLYYGLAAIITDMSKCYGPIHVVHTTHVKPWGWTQIQPPNYCSTCGWQLHTHNKLELLYHYHFRIWSTLMSSMVHRIEISHHVWGL